MVKQLVFLWISRKLREPSTYVGIMSLISALVLQLTGVEIPLGAQADIANGLMELVLAIFGAIMVGIDSKRTKQEKRLEKL